MRSTTEEDRPILSRQWPAAVKLVETGDIEEALLALLRLPDRVASCSAEPENDYCMMADYLGGRAPESPLERALSALVQGLCLARAGFAIRSLECMTRAAAEAMRISDHRRSACIGALAACGEAQAAIRAGDRALAVRRARRAIAAAAAVGADWLRAHAQHTLGRALSVDPAQRSRAYALLSEARSAYRAASPRDIRGEGYVLQSLARLRSDDGQTENALALLHQSLALMRRSHAGRAAAGVLLDIAWLRSYQQSHALARSYGRQALHALDECNDYRGTVRAYHLIGWTHLHERHLDEARVEFDCAHDLAVRVDCLALKAACRYFLARCAFAGGDGRACREHVEAATALRGVDPLTDASVQALTAALAVRNHQWKRSAELLRRLVGDLQALRVPRLEADGLFLCGFELCREGRPEQAAPLIRRALAVAESTQASGQVQAFLSAAQGVGLELWLTAVASAVKGGAESAQRLVDRGHAAAFGFHDLKNAAVRLQSIAQNHEEAPSSDALQSIAEQAEAAAAFARDLEQAFLHGQEALTPKLQPFDLAAWVRDQAEVSNRWPVAGITYQADAEPGLPRVMADERVLTRVMENLRSNAEKYAPNSRVVLSAKAKRDRRGHLTGVVLGFSDDGPGIHPQDLEIIFKPYKASTEYKLKRANHGSGVGLGYCRALVEAHGGHIRAESKLGKGTTFCVELPVEQPHPGEQPR